MLRSHKERVAVIGGGIAGVCSAELLARRGFRVELFEKHSSIGGCAGSFTRDGFIFNVGATTIAGLIQNYPVGEILSELKVLHYAEIREPSIVVHTPKGVLKRYSNLEKTLDEINRIFPHCRNREFWNLVFKVTHDILTKKYYHNFSSPTEAIKSFYSMKEVIIKYHKLYFMPALKGLSYFFDKIESDYLNFMDAHVKIVAQSNIREVSMITLLLSLGYPFTGVGYVKQGMFSLLSGILNESLCFTNSEIHSIIRKYNGFIVKGNFGEEWFRRIVLAIPIFEHLNIIETPEIKSYFKKYINLQSDNSALVLYGVVEKSYPEDNFHLCLLEKPLPFTESSYIFFSFNDPNNDNKRTFTVSTHTSTKYWHNLPKEDYDRRKNILKNFMIKSACEFFNFDEKDIKMSFLATPESFYRYIGRRSVGGIPVTIKNTLWRIPSNFTPFRGLYLVGDSFFCYQGWLGISIGVKNLIENLDEKI